VVTVRDENSGLAEKPVQVARKNLSPADGRRFPQERSSLPVARVRRTGSGALDLDPHFVPPLLDFAASDYLAAIARRLVEILATKSSMLSGVRRQKNLSLAEFGRRTSPTSGCSNTINFHFPDSGTCLNPSRASRTAVRSDALGWLAV